MVDHSQRAARVALARVAAALADAGADEHVRYLLDVAGVFVHLFALVVRYDGHVHVLNNIGQRSVCDIPYTSLRLVE